MNLPWVTNRTAQGILVVTHYVYPIVLLIFFLFAFTLRSILTTEKVNPDTPAVAETGPGGKPLPKKNITKVNADANLDFSRPRKLLFDWLSVFTALTFIANATAIIIHALWKRRQGWWCGKDVVVRILPLQNTT